MKDIFNFDPTLLLQAFGFIFLSLGVAARLGLWKKWYWRTKGAVYSYVPLGLLFLVYSFNELAKARLGQYFWMYQALFGVLIVLGIWLSFRPPKFVKPAWVRWVEAQPAQVVKDMEQDALDDPNWERHVTSPEAVDTWAKSLKLKKPKPKTSSQSRK